MCGRSVRNKEEQIRTSWGPKDCSLRWNREQVPEKSGALRHTSIEIKCLKGKINFNSSPFNDYCHLAKGPCLFFPSHLNYHSTHVASNHLNLKSHMLNLAMPYMNCYQFNTKETKSLCIIFVKRITFTNIYFLSTFEKFAFGKTMYHIRKYYAIF